jgi:nucleotide-binding universal stress UspA family protein
MAQTDTETLSRPKTRLIGDIVVHAQPGDRATHRVKMAARLARDFDARLIGVAAEAIEPIPAVDPYSGALTAEWITAANEQVSADLKGAEKAFKRDAEGAETDWRAVREQPALALSRYARGADLIVAGGASDERIDRYRTADPADLVLTSGRPVLVVPAQGHALKAKTVLVAWKDTREARRALSDAMPFLVRADDVIVQVVASERDQAAARESVQDVVDHLKRLGVKARPQVTVESKADAAEELVAAAVAAGADLIVAGAYGHSRMQEWALGGVTRDLLRNPTRYLLLSH